NTLDASFLVEAPITDNISFAAGARRSYIDFFFDKIVPDEAFDVVAAPVYWDYQAFLTWRPTNKDRVHLSWYGSSDRLELVFGNPIDGDPALGGGFDQDTSFHRGQVSWERKLSKDIDQELLFSFGPTNVLFALGDTLSFDGDFFEMNGRAEWTARVTPDVRLVGGMDIQVIPFSIGYTGPPPTQAEGNPNSMAPLSSRTTSTVASSDVAYRPAAYAEMSLRPIDPLEFIVGMRADWYREIQEWSVDPRAAAILSLSDDTRLKGGVGIFSQPPEFQESSEILGNPNLDPNHALHTSAGVEHDIIPGLSVGAEGYFKYLWDRVVGTQGGVAPRFNNDGVGRIYGMELSGRFSPESQRWFGYFSYTLSRSERRDHPGEIWRVFDFDQSHILTIAGVYRLGRGWEAGGTFRLVTGNPETPIVGGEYYANTDIYLPRYGATNSGRVGAFHRLDIRVEKKWDFQAWKLALYLDIQNVYNRQNPEGTFHNYDFSESSTLSGLPFLPSLGIRGEL
ncbi:MAG: TonB-dependent receptor, partial [Myxococcales bacterium]|nr:TonB-dependent receptor [Myxococcales bacterium]